MIAGVSFIAHAGWKDKRRQSNTVQVILKGQDRREKSENITGVDVSDPSARVFMINIELCLYYSNSNNPRH